METSPVPCGSQGSPRSRDGNPRSRRDRKPQPETPTIAAEAAMKAAEPSETATEAPEAATESAAAMEAAETSPAMEAAKAAMPTKCQGRTVQAQRRTEHHGRQEGAKAVHRSFPSRRHGKRAGEVPKNAAARTRGVDAARRSGTQPGPPGENYIPNWRGLKNIITGRQLTIPRWRRFWRGFRSSRQLFRPKRKSPPSRARQP